MKNLSHCETVLGAGMALLVIACSRQVDASVEDLNACTFNVQFLGNSRARDNDALAGLLRDMDCDLVFVQELLAAPGSDPEVDAFFAAMARAGFTKYVLSDGDTGPKKIGTKSSSSEWWVSFYDSARVEVAPDLPHGYLSSTRVKNREYDRVPYAFSFRSVATGFDFVVISTHLRPGADQEDRRIEELSAVVGWIHANESHENDFMIVGDMNFDDRNEVGEVLDAIGTSISKDGRAQEEWRSLNEESVSTNTSAAAGGAGHPYDQVLLRPEFTRDDEIELHHNFDVVSLTERMAGAWAKRHGKEAYPGDPSSYDHTLFRQEYSDHSPVRFRIAGRVDRD